MKKMIIILGLLICIALTLSMGAIAGMPTLTSGGAWKKSKPSEAKVEKEKPAEEPKKIRKSIYDVEEKVEVEIDLVVIKFKIDRDQAVARIGNLVPGEPLENVKVSFYVWEESLKGDDWKKLSDQYIEKLESGIKNYTELSVKLSSRDQDKLLKVMVDPDVKMSEDYTANNFKETGIRKASSLGTMTYRGKE